MSSPKRSASSIDVQPTVKKVHLTVDQSDGQNKEQSDGQNQTRQDANIALELIDFIKKNKSPYEDQKTEEKQKISQKTEEQQNPTSLRQSAIDFIKKQPGGKTSQVLKLFTSGVENKLTFQQDRLQDACITKDQNSIESSLIVFCPTYTVTPNVFKNILKQRSTSMIIGHPGIGKSISALLLSFLSQIVFKYTQSVFDQSKGCIASHSQKAKTDIVEHFKMAPKFVYISLNKGKKKEELKQMILTQLRGQMDQKDQDDELFYKKIKKIKKYYEENFGCKVILIVDQINTIASTVRQYQYALNFQKYLSKQNEGEFSKKEQLELFLEKQIQRIFNKDFGEIQENNKWAKQILKFLLGIKPQFSNIRYLSSVNIQQKLLKDLNLNGQQNHNKIKIYEIQFLKNFHKRSVRYDLLDYLQFQLKLRLSQCTTAQKQKNNYHNDLQLDEQISSHMKAANLFLKETKIYINPFTIRNFLVEYLEKLEPQNICQKVFSNSNFETFLKGLENSTYLQIYEKVLKFFQNDKTPEKIRHKCALQIYYESQRILRESKSSSDSTKQNEQSPKMKIPLKNEIEIWNYCYDVDKSIFKLAQFIDSMTVCIQLLLPLETVVKILQTKIQTIFESPDFSDLTKYIRKGPAFGQVVQQVLINILSDKNINWTIFQSNHNGINILKNFTTGSKIFNFRPLPHQYKTTSTKKFKKIQNYMFTESIINQLKSIKSEQNRSFLFVPFNDKKGDSYKQDKTNTNIFGRCMTSKAIDFVVARYCKDSQNKNPQKLILQLFDLTTSEREITQKIKKFLAAYLTFKDRHEVLQSKNGKTLEIQINYVVLLPQMCVKQKPQQLFEKIQSIWKPQMSDPKKQQILKSIGFATFNPQNNWSQSKKVLTLKRMLENYQPQENIPNTQEELTQGDTRPEQQNQVQAPRVQE